MSQPLARLDLVVSGSIDKPCVHLCDLDSGCREVGYIELQSKGAELFELDLVNDCVLVIGETHLERPILSPFKVVYGPHDFSLLQVTICETVPRGGCTLGS